MTPTRTIALTALFMITACAPSEPAQPAPSDPAADAGGAVDVGSMADAEPAADVGSMADVEPAADASPMTDTDEMSDASTPTPEPVFTHKMMKATGENMFASLAYECPQCTFAQQQAIVAPEGWTKGPTQVAVFTSGEMRSRPSFDGVPDAVDFLPEVPGDEYQLIAKNLDATIVERGASGIVVIAQVMRDTLFRFEAGLRVHELTDPEGNVFVLFAYGVDPADPTLPDIQDPNLLDDFTAPEGWTYGSRLLEEELLLDTPDIAQVLAIRGQQDSTWEMR